MKKIVLLIIIISFIISGYAQKPGDPDPSFGINGIVKSEIGAHFNYPLNGERVLSHPGGGIYIISETNGMTIIAKKNANGSPDLTYGTNGFSAAVAIYYVKDAFLEADGKIVIVGLISSLSDDTQYFGVARFDANGKLDNTFGLVESAFGGGSLSYPNALAVQPDGKVVVVGHSYYLNDFDELYFEVARFNTDGRLDSTFNSVGLLSLELDQQAALSVAIQPDGKIVIVGESIVVRCNSNGSFDSNFNEIGIQYIDPISYSDIPTHSVALQTDGKIVIAGTYDNYESGSSNDFIVTRLNADGSLDMSFGEDGKQLTDFGQGNDQATSIRIQADGIITLFGFTGDNSLAIARYTAKGILDNSYSGDGKQVINFSFTGHFPTFAALQSDGKLLALGYPNTAAGVYLARFTINGTLDNSFDHDGILTDQLVFNNTHYTCIAAQPDGKIVTAGYSWNGSNYDFTVARYNVNGSFDETFSVDGKVTTDFAATDDKAKGIAIQPDGKIVVVGSAGNNFGIIRYNSNGSLDKTFDGDGLATTDFGADDYATSVVIQPNGKIIAAGSGIARYNANGSPDLTFNRTGKVSTSRICNDVALQNNGKIVVTGGLEVSRYNIDGTTDNTFGDNGTGYYDQFLSGDDGIDFKSLVIQNDGKILLGGSYEYSYRSSFLSSILVRLNNDGSVDENFSANGANFNGIDYTTSLELQSDNKIILSGFVDYTNNNFAIARYNNDGSLDKSFGDGGKKVFVASPGEDTITGSVLVGNRLYVSGTGQYPGYVGIVGKYFLFENKAPVVKIINPVNNTVYNAPATFTIEAEASDADGTINYVQFYNNGTLVKTDSTSPYSYAISNSSGGNYSFVAKASDNNELTSNSASVSVSVTVSANKAPGVSITTPVNNATYTSPATINLTAAANDPDGTISGVKFFSGSTLLATDNTSPYSYTLNNAKTGTYKFYAVATDNKGLTSSSATVSVFVGSTQSNKSPFVALSAPANNAEYTQPAAITLSANANDADGNVKSVSFYKDGTLLSTDNVSPYTYTIKDLPAGKYSFVAKAVDDLGSTNNSASVTVIVSGAVNKTPDVSINSPVNNAVLYTPVNILLDATASDSDGISNVKFYNRATLLTTDTEGPYTYTLNNAPPGTYSIVAKATDKQGFSSSSSSVQVTVVDNKAPAVDVSVYPEAAIAPADITINVQASDPDGTIKYVRYYNGTSLLYTDSTSIDYYSFLWENVAAGSYTITAEATDDHGRTTTSREIHLTVLAQATLEAEDASLNGAIAASSAPGFQGSGYADYVHASGDFIEWSYKASTADPVVLRFRYANGDNTNRPLQLKVNNVVVSTALDFSPTGSWTNWFFSDATVNLISGVNKIRLTTTGLNGPNVDNLTPIANTGTLEAEQAFLSGAVIAASATGFRGTGYADCVNATGDFVEWIVNASIGDFYSLKFRYANGSTTNRPLQLKINGGVVNAALDFLPTGGWATWSVSSLTGELDQGANTIRLTTIGSNGPNLDNLAYSKNSPTLSVQKIAASKSKSLAEPHLFKAMVTPNPAAGNAKLILSGASALPVSVDIVDMLGRKLKSFKVIPAGANAIDLPVNEMTPGSYVITAKQGNLRAYARLVVAKR